MQDCRVSPRPFPSNDRLKAFKARLDAAAVEEKS